MRNIFVTIAVIIIFLNSIAYARPIYLNCNVRFDKSNTNYYIILDESTGKITHKGEIELYDIYGFFSKDKISYKIRLNNCFGPFYFVYEIDRNNLDISQSIQSKYYDMQMVGNGSCTMEKPKDRKI